MRAYFSEGDWVFYNNRQSQFHMSLFQIIRIVPMTLSSSGGYDLRYGSRQVFARTDEILHKQDPQVKQNLMILPLPALLPATGRELDEIGAMYGLSRTDAEPDNNYRQRLHDFKRNGFQVVSDPSMKKDAAILVQAGQVVGKITNLGATNPHAGHEVITNHAGGKEFKYCRKCKVEVYE